MEILNVHNKWKKRISFVSHAVPKNVANWSLKSEPYWTEMFVYRYTPVPVENLDDVNMCLADTL